MNITISIKLVCLVGVVFLLQGCGKLVDPEKTKAAISWLKQNYEKFPIGGGWQLTKIEANKHYIKVWVGMSDEDATVLVKMDAKPELRYLSSATCPNRHEPIWQIIDENHIIEMNFWSPGYKLFSSVDCKSVLKMFGNW